MVAIYLAPAYLAVCAYILFRTIHWIQVLHSIFQNVWVCRGIGLIYFFVVFSILIAFMAPASGFRRFMKLLSNYWLGVLGEYIGKIYMEVKHRPRYIISERTGEQEEGKKAS